MSFRIFNINTDLLLLIFVGSVLFCYCIIKLLFLSQVIDGLKISEQLYLTKEKNSLEAFPSRILKFVENPDKKKASA